MTNSEQMIWAAAYSYAYVYHGDASTAIRIADTAVEAAKGQLKSIAHQFGNDETIYQNLADMVGTRHVLYLSRDSMSDSIRSILAEGINVCKICEMTGAELEMCPQCPGK